MINRQSSEYQYFLYLLKKGCPLILRNLIDSTVASFAGCFIAFYVGSLLVYFVYELSRIHLL